ncbi:MAG: ribosome maturation factor RimM [Chitinophagaceae bacterium]
MKQTFVFHKHHRCHSPVRHTFRQRMDNYFKIGKLVATYALKGEIILQHSLGKKTSLKGLETLFIEEKKDSFIPYFIESAKIKSATETYVKFEGISSKETAHKLIQKEIWLLENDFKKFADKSAPISLLGFTMINDEEDLGEILEIIEQPHQVLCKILLKGKEALIPIHEEFLDKIDKKNRKVFLTLPDGLLEIYR